MCGLNDAGLRSLYNKFGDPGDVAFEAKKRQSFTLRKPKPLTIKSVFDSLVKIANSKGLGSVETKQRIVERLLQDARGAEESRYIVRTLVQHVCVQFYFGVPFYPKHRAPNIMKKALLLFFNDTLYSIMKPLRRHVLTVHSFESVP